MIDPRHLEVGAILAFVAMLALASAVFDRPRSAGFVADFGTATGRFAVVLGIRVFAELWHGAWAAEAQIANAGLLAVMLSIGLLPKPVIPMVGAGVVLVRTVAALTSQDALLFYGAAFVAQLSQGVAHDVTWQKATLLSHEDSKHDRATSLAFEWSHVVYFPNLLMHSAHQSLVGKGRKEQVA